MHSTNTRDCIHCCGGPGCPWNCNHNSNPPLLSIIRWGSACVCKCVCVCFCECVSPIPWASGENESSLSERDKATLCTRVCTGKKKTPLTHVRTQNSAVFSSFVFYFHFVISLDFTSHSANSTSCPHGQQACRFIA